MTSHHVTCHVTAVSHASLLSKRKEKEKENQYKIRKIKEKKNKIVSVQVSYNTWLQLMCCTICLPHGHNFRERDKVQGEGEY